ncbi:YfbU family protein [Glacieibacterium megasporae]|uniref:YfbU family protein n=1 Tax=Glacieibacterium megasporae TaxID=2835787 RepID=UPI001C1E3B4C|nr:YfbU family protein [Polymorphobacter megasporae]UAJ12995.1 YfbU family protein [Polymorphobacter megasporae]
MQMSDGERLIIVMLAEVMEALKLDQEIDPALVKTLVINNDGWALKRKYSGIFHSEAPSDDVVSETTNILWMWGIIEHSIASLTGVEANEAKGWHWTKWDGFDGNNDDHYGVARTMIEDLGEFEDSRKGINLNSHSQTLLPRYRRMYEKFDAHVKAGKASPLSFDALRDLCS